MMWESQVEHNRDGDQPADHMGLNCGKPGGMGQKIDLIRFICTQRIWIKDPVISISMADIHNPSFIAISVNICWMSGKIQNFISTL
jgi:hypothetical protein